MITSAQNAKVKLARALLGRAKERREANAFVAEGVRLVEEAEKRDWRFETVLYDESLSERGRSLVERLTSRGVETLMVSSDVMKSLSDTEWPQGILAILQSSQLPILNSPNFILIPDQIRDPGNLGTLLRSASAAGVDAVLLPPETTDAFAPKVVRAGMGAHFNLSIHEMSWDEIAQFTKNSIAQVFLADMNGQPCWDADLSNPLALIIGGEAEGASEAARKLAAQSISVPMAGQAESLNAATAGAVLMFEVLRQRRN